MKRLFFENISNKRFYNKEAFKEYSNTLKLPKTEFSMRSNATIKEPELQKICCEFLYKEQNKRETDKNFVLHDGPPFANGTL